MKSAAMKQEAITPDVVAEHGLTPDEYKRVLKVLGHAPQQPKPVAALS